MENKGEVWKMEKKGGQSFFKSATSASLLSQNSVS